MLKTYNSLIESGQLRADAAQAELANHLDKLEKAIYEYAEDSNSLKARYLGLKPNPPKGAYVYGKVGRGKSMIVDMFYEKLEIKGKKRMHFHEFMRKVHDEIHLFRSYGAADPVEQVAHAMAKGLVLFCFDEFEVSDVTDAMILSKLFEKMMEEGVVLIFTSNRRPEDHYKDGLQRKSYVEFCDVLASKADIVSLDSEQDYRTIETDSDIENFFSPLGYAATKELKKRYKEIGGGSVKKITLEVKGRELQFKASGKILRANFNELCGKALGSGDYLEIAQNFEAIILEDIPQMKPELRNEAKRFVTLIDVLYENKILLICAADAEPSELYTSGSGDFEFRRTASRLTEMRKWSV